MGKDMRKLLLGLLVWKYYRLLMHELVEVREVLGEGWEERRRNLAGVEEKYFPVLDGLYRLARLMRRDAEALTAAEEGDEMITTPWGEFVEEERAETRRLAVEGVEVGEGDEAIAKQAEGDGGVRWWRRLRQKR